MKIKTMVYEYSKINRIESPNIYMYTLYNGKDFLNEFFEYRKECQEKILENLFSNQNSSEKIELTKVGSCVINFANKIKILEENNKISNSLIIQEFDKFSLEETNSFLETLGNEEIITKSALEKLILMMLNVDNKEKFYFVLSKLLKKFEVTKKICDSYAKNFVKNESDYRTIKNYILLSFLIMDYYNFSRNFKFLNATLKINDTICSVIDKIETREELIISYLLLKLEKQAISSLIKTKKVEL
ncbi:MAG: hypothetical protein JSW73_04360 [Candidatus Woesearchaeota archaeon]|nr:MAG: hypothetical protein JSW73_04360 [Candidatus Woesearchaeota archaeon]